MSNGGEILTETGGSALLRGQSSVTRGSYANVLKSSAVIGGSSLINIGLGIARTKVLALLLGPSGIGLLGLYNSLLDLARTVAAAGIGSSGVRQIADAVARDDDAALSKTATALRITAVLLGITGLVFVAGLAHPVSWISFGTTDHRWAVALLGVAVFFGTISGGQVALIQGMRRIRDLAAVSIFSSLFGLLVAVPVVYFLGSQGIVPSIVLVAGAGLVVSWWYSRKIKVARVVLGRPELWTEVRGLLHLGLVFMASSFMMMGVNYLVRTIVLRQMGEEAAGFYQAAWALGGLYVGFILQAMGADFFPRLTGVASNNSECNRMVNEQAEVSLLLAGPGIIGTLTFAPLVIQVFYSDKFGPAIEILRWICLGMMLRVASWPMSFLLIAKGSKQPYFWSELAANGVQVLFVWLGLRWFGLKGTGVAFFGGYVFYWFLIYFIVHSVSGFRWSAANRRVGSLFALLIAGVFAITEFLQPWAAMLLGGLITCAAAVISLKTISGLIPVERLPRTLQRILIYFRFIHADSKG